MYWQLNRFWLYLMNLWFFPNFSFLSWKTTQIQKIYIILTNIFTTPASHHQLTTRPTPQTNYKMLIESYLWLWATIHHCQADPVLHKAKRTLTRLSLIKVILYRCIIFSSAVLTNMYYIFTYMYLSLISKSFLKL